MRTQLYFIMMALSIAAMVGAAVIRKRLAAGLGGWEAALIAVGFYLGAVAIAAAILPPINEVPADFPAVVLWHFRMDSLSMQAIMWAVIGLGFGALTERSLIAQGHYRPRLSPKLVWR